MKHKSPKAFSILLSLLMLLSVFGALTFTAGAESESTGHDIVLTSSWAEEWYDVACTPSQTDIPAGTQVTVTITKKYKCVNYAGILWLRSRDWKLDYAFTPTENGYRAELEMPDEDLNLYVTNIQVSHGGGPDIFEDSDPEQYPYTANGLTATGYQTSRCCYCGYKNYHSGAPTANIVTLTTTDPTLSLSFFQFVQSDEARERPFPASEYAIPGQFVYFKLNDKDGIPQEGFRITALNEADSRESIPFSFSNGYYCFTMPAYPVQIVTGNCVQFGTYPQTCVEETPALKAAAEKATWKSYGYYSGSGDYRDGQMKPADYMKFADFFVGTEKYRAVLFTKWRPFYTGYVAGDNKYHSVQWENGLQENTTYYYKYEPLTWRILDPAEGLVLCENLIDAQAYNNTWYYDSAVRQYYQAIGSTVDANDYAASSIRAWLNEDFYQTAFNNVQKANIKTAELVYDKRSEDGSYAYDEGTVNDKIFLPSYADMTNPAYGFDAENTGNEIWMAFGTDYAACQGVPVFEGASAPAWRLRTADTYTGAVYYADGDKGLMSAWAPQTDFGIRPACELNVLKSDVSCNSYLYSAGAHGHIAGKIVLEDETPATCTQSGSRTEATYCTECGAFIGRATSEIDALGHTPGEAAVENFVLPTTEADGGYDLVVTCSVCGDEYSRTHVTLDQLAPSDEHVPGKSVVENYTEPTVEKEGSLEIVVYCADCGVELSRERVTLPKLTPTEQEQPEEPDAPTPADGDRLCKYCGKDHSGSFFQRFVGFFHRIAYFFAHLFGKM